MVFVLGYSLLTIIFGTTTITLQDDTNYRLFGYLTLASICVLTAMPLHNSLFNLILGIPFDRLVRFHTYMGTGAVILALIHGSLYLRFWSFYNFLVESILQQPVAIYGVSSGCILVFILVTSFVLVRRLSFELFYYCHLLAFVSLVALLFYHLPNTDFYTTMLLSILLFAFNRLIRLVRTAHRTTVVSHKVVHNEVTRIQFNKSPLLSKLLDGRPGQFFLIQVPSIWPLSWHPFSIISATNSHQVSAKDEESSSSTQAPFAYEVAIYGQGYFTKKIQQHSGSLILTDGPYGNAFDGVLNHQTIVLVGGGIGVTPLLSIINTIIASREHKEYVRAVHLIWSIKRHSQIEWFNDVLERAVDHGITICIHVTQPPMPSIKTKFEIKSGRPDYEQIFRSIKPSGSNVSVASCGPKPLMFSVAKACARSSDSGSLFIHFHEEFSM